jgi:uncharacterized membrane protein (DUF2068 family)
VLLLVLAAAGLWHIHRGGQPYVYYAHMASANIYLPADLAQAVKAEQVPISEVCQRALQAELARIRAERHARQHILWDDQSTIRRP